jgi:hypothetical protein
VSNAPSKPVSFSRPKVGYFSNRPRILVMPIGLICNTVCFHVKDHLPVNSVLEMRCHVLWSVVATVQEESIWLCFERGWM